jgi:hypothetical protein
VLRAVGLGLAMMPIMTGGLSAVPPDRVDGASAFNNLTQRTTAALGLAVLTTLVAKSRAQLDTALGIPLALMLRSGPAQAGGWAAPAAH